jgi:hypothetical protein
MGGNILDYQHMGRWFDHEHHHYSLGGHSTKILFFRELMIECQGINTILIIDWEKSKTQ